MDRAGIYHNAKGDTMTRSDYEERRENRIERFKELADKNAEKAEQLSDQAHKMADVIPLGQPILIGHYSEKGDRNYRARISNTFDKAMETHDKSKYYAEKATSAESNTAISSDNPNALDLLKAKLAKCQAFQERAKTINKIIRKKTTDEEKVKELIGIGLTEYLAKEHLKPDYAGRIGVPAFELTNNNGNMKRIKDRIAALEKESTEITTEQMIGDITIINSIEENRILITFPGVPDEGIRAMLKADGFRWSPTNKAWQAFRSAAWKIPGIIKRLTVMPVYVNPSMIPAEGMI